MIVEVEVLTARSISVTVRDGANTWATTLGLSGLQAVELAAALRGAVDTQHKLWPEGAL